MKLTALLSVLVMGFLISSGDCLKFDYYKSTCPQAESVIAEMMKDMFTKRLNIAADLIRLHFHDCFVRGCDGSVLLNSTSSNKAEKDAPPNLSLEGFDKIDKIKKTLEKNCPKVVSCADIVAYTARESVFLSGRFPHYAVKGGRKDGRISRAAEAIQNLPPPSFNATSLIKSPPLEARALCQALRYFTRFWSPGLEPTIRNDLKGLSVEDMVTLSGAHSIGDSFCTSVNGRFNNFNNTGKPDPTLNKNLAASLRRHCKNLNNKVELDTITPNNLDNKYYTGLLQNKGLFTSDATLLTNAQTLQEVQTNAALKSIWETKFVLAMVKMGEIEVLTGKQGEVRRSCRFVN